MIIERATLNDCHLAQDKVVVIDVLRAFTTAAFAFEVGAEEIILVSTIQEAFALKSTFPDALLLGEEHGLPIQGFDFGNSPYELLNKNLTGKRLIQRTSAGTQGVVKAQRAKQILVTGLCNASATTSFLKQMSIKNLVLVETGVRNTQSGLEDIACADLLEALMLNRAYDLDAISQRVYEAPAAKKFLDETLEAFPKGDLECALQIDKFNFAMQVHSLDGKAHLRKVVL